MKRREFVRNLSLASVAITAGTIRGFGAGFYVTGAFSSIDTFSLNGFADEQEEYPRLVTNGTGESWMFSLRRLPFPQNKEEIAAYKLVNGKWLESGTASIKAGQYENPTAVCLHGGEPFVAWNNLTDGKWDVQVTQFKQGKPSKPVIFISKKGRAVNPKLFAGENGNIWLVWENYYQSKFSICISKYQGGNWSESKQVTPDDKVCFDPAVAEGKDGKLYIVYGTTDGFHQNIEMKVIDHDSTESATVVPIAIGGGLANRVNLNTKPAVAFDKNNRLWISWENNRNNTRLDDGDNYTGDRCCSMVCYIDGKLMEPLTGKWLFESKNDHLPNFVRDSNNNLFAFTRCGGDFDNNPNWSFRFSSLQPDGWSKPVTFLATKQKGQTTIPSVIFDDNHKFWLAWRIEQFVKSKEGMKIKETKVNLSGFISPEIQNGTDKIQFRPAVIEELHPKKIDSIRTGGRLRTERKKMVYKGEEYTLLLNYFNAGVMLNIADVQGKITLTGTEQPIVMKHLLTTP